MVRNGKERTMHWDDFRITEKDKQKRDYIENSANYWIASLYRRETKYKTYRNYYSGIRDEEEFEHITDNYGIGTPTSLGFTPIIKPRIDSLLSQLEIETFNYSVSCTDESTIDAIRDKKENDRLSSINAVVDKYISIAKDTITSIEEGVSIESSRQMAEQIAKVNSKFGEAYVDDFVAAAIDVLRYFESASHIDVRQKLKQMLMDLLVTGECYYRVYINRVGSDPIFEVIKPENIFFNKNTNSQYIDTADAVVHREYMTRSEILTKYGMMMSTEQKKDIFGQMVSGVGGRSIADGRYMDYNYSDSDTFGQKSMSLHDSIEVFHVEWLAPNEIDISEYEKELLTSTEGTLSKTHKKYRIDRYEVTRIAGTNFVNGGKSKHINRSMDNPYECGFTYDGVLYNDRNGDPYSLVGALKDLQDAYDLIIFHRDNLVANSGVSGDRVNLAGIPKILGDDMMDRLFKFMALKKNGVELYNPTEPGANLFNHYGEFDNSVNGNSITAINSILTMIQAQADIVAGTNPQMLGQIAERDAVSNVKMGIQRSLMRNQDLFELFRNTHNRLLNNFIKAGQKAYSKGKKGSYIMGPKSYTFRILPEVFCYSDYAITINYSSKDEMKVGRLQTIAKEFASSGVLDPPTLAEAIMSESASEVNKLITRGYNKFKEENDKIQQASQKIDELTKQVQQAADELKKAQDMVAKLEKVDAELKNREVAVKEQVAKDTKTIKDKENSIIEEHYNNQDILKTEAVKLEREQLYMGEGPAKEVRNNI